MKAKDIKVGDEVIFVLKSIDNGTELVSKLPIKIMKLTGTKVTFKWPNGDEVETDLKKFAKLAKRNIKV